MRHDVGEIANDTIAKFVNTRKANVVGPMLKARKERIKPLRVFELSFGLLCDMPAQILNAQTETRKTKNFKMEMIEDFDYA
ncbi:hypothetical protein Tco_0415086 [Tanacetum coccineum]